MDSLGFQMWAWTATITNMTSQITSGSPKCVFLCHDMHICLRPLDFFMIGTLCSKKADYFTAGSCCSLWVDLCFSQWTFLARDNFYVCVCVFVHGWQVFSGEVTFSWRVDVFTMDRVSHDWYIISRQASFFTT